MKQTTLNEGDEEKIQRPHQTKCLLNPLKTYRILGDGGLLEKSESQILLNSPRAMSNRSYKSQRELCLNNLQLREMPKVHLTKYQLERLDLSNNNICQYTSHFKEFTQLKSLILDSNRLVNLPNEFNQYHPSLIELSVNYNILVQLPELPSTLEILSIEYNYIRIYPIQSSLRILHIQGNPINCITYQQNLKELSIDWVKLLGWNPLLRGGELEQINKWLLCGDNTKDIKSMIHYFFQDKFDFNQIDYLGRTILHQAVINEDLGILVGCSELCDINKNDVNFQSPIQLAIRNDKAKCAKILIKMGANLINKQLLIYAVQKQQLNLAKILLHNQVNPNETDYEGNTPLHFVMSRWSNMKEPLLYSRMLLKYGACPTLRNDFGYSPLHLAIKRGEVNAIQFAIDYFPLHMDPDKCKHGFDFQQKTGQSQQSCIELSIVYNQCYIASLLMDLEDNVVEIPRTLQNHNTIYKLIQKRNKQILEYIYENNVQIFKHQQHQQLCIYAQQQWKLTEQTIHIPNNFSSSTQCKSYFKNNNQSLKIKKGDKNDYIDSEDSIDSREELRFSSRSINYSENLLYIKGMGVPKLAPQINQDLNKQADQAYKDFVKLKTTADSYFNEFLICDNPATQAHILTLLIKVNLTIKKDSDSYITQLIRQLFNEQYSISNLEEGSSICDEQHSIQIREFKFYKNEEEQDELSDCNSSSSKETQKSLVIDKGSVHEMKKQYNSLLTEYMIRYLLLQKVSQIPLASNFQLFQYYEMCNQ